MIGSQVDIIMPVFNKPDLTRACLESIKANTDTRYRIILIDNGSRKGVYVYKGRITSAPIAKRFNLKYTDLDLLLATHS